MNKNLDFNKKYSIWFSIVGIIFYIFVYKAFELFYLFKIPSASITANILFYVLNIAFIVGLVYLFTKIIKNNLKTSKTAKELFSKAGAFTLITFISLLLIQLALWSPAIESTMGAGMLMLWFVLGFILFNMVYYLVIAFKKWIN